MISSHGEAEVVHKDDGTEGAPHGDRTVGDEWYSCASRARGRHDSVDEQDVVRSAASNFP